MKVNVDDKALADPRFDRLGARLKINRHEALGRCLRVWNFAYQKRSAMMSTSDVDALADCKGFAKAMIAVDLADAKRGDKVRVRGTKDQIEWLLGQDAKRAKANAARALLRDRPPGSSLDEDREQEGPSPGMSPGGVPVNSDRDRDRDRAVAVVPEGTTTATATATATELTALLASLPATASGWRPSPAGRAITRWKEKGLSSEALGEIWHSFCDKTADTQFHGDKHRENALAKFVDGYKPQRRNSKRTRRDDADYLEPL